MSKPFEVENVRKTGLTVLYEPVMAVERIVDVVFVHGLQGHPRNTWTCEADRSQAGNLVPIETGGKRRKFQFWRKKNETAGSPSGTTATASPSAVFWPYHFLPQDCPNSRILTWGYDSKISNFFDGAANMNNVLSHSRDLLGDLSGQRGKGSSVPLAFVAHSLGGIVVKQMLLRASRSSDKRYKDIFTSTSAILFLGTPHAGSPHAELGEILRNVIRAIGFDGAGQNLVTLRPDSTLLEQCREEFYLLYKTGAFEVYTFQEAKGPTGTSFGPFRDKVVPDVSSDFLGSEKRFTINADHQAMCRFSSKDDDGYMKISRELLHISQRIAEMKGREQMKADTEMKDTIKSFIALLDFEEMDYREQEIRKAHINSCNWILEHPSYREWTSKRHGLLGIRGKPGSGKSTIMKRIFRLLSEREDPNHVQLTFFFHRRGTPLQHTRIGMFRTLLYQVLNKVPSAGREFYNLCERKQRWQGDSGKDWDWRLEELQEAFSCAVLAAVKDYSITIFIDALDEAGEDTARDIISYIYDLYDKLFKLGATISICLSCRHFPILTIDNGFEICLEDNNQKDIETYALAELKKGLGEDGNPLVELQADVVTRASGVFMWVALVVPLVTRHYKNGKSLDFIRQTLQAVPSEVEEVYRHILTEVVDQNDRPQTLHLMQWIYLAERPLSLTEIRFAIASDHLIINSTQYSCRDSIFFVEDDTRMKKLIISLTGGLAEIKYHSQSNRGQEATVQFIHQTVNDFLSKDRFRCLGLDEAECLIGQGHHRLSRSCINYLQLGEVRNRSHLYKRNDNDYITEGTLKQLKDGFPFLGYATIFWAIHAEKAESYGIPQQDLLCHLKWPSDEFFLDWIETFRSIEHYHIRCPSQGARLLHIAAASNLKTTLKALLAKKANIEEEDEEGNRPIHYAARWGHDRIVRILLDERSEVGAKNRYGDTALERAARAGHETVVSLILGGIDGDIKSHLNLAFLAAATAGNDKLMWLLLKQGAEVNAEGGEYGNALQAAAFSGSEAVVKMLLEQGAEVNAEGGEYGNAMQAAARFGREAVVKMLLEQGAEVNAKGGHFGNALQAAARLKYKGIVQLLLEHGGNREDVLEEITGDSAKEESDSRKENMR